jgi:molybdenum cofactor sulfurtransferase
VPSTSSGIRFRSERYAEAFASFVAAYPDFGSTARIDSCRERDYGRLDAQGHTYLDYTGGGLYGESQIRAHHDILTAGVFGNPHSHNPTSLAATRLVDETRAAVLDFFHASADEYDVVFTLNASGALKLIGEAFPFETGGTYLLSFDNHNSVNGVREYARRNGAQVIYVPVRDPDLRLDEHLVLHHLQTAARGRARLFAYPAQSNFSGVQHPLAWIALARAEGWQVLLDAAAFAPTNRLDLAELQPDFVTLSFYKMFGYPTGAGALLARREALASLRRPWFSGGTITLASVQGDGWHHLAPGHAGFEDGTVDYLGLPAVTLGLHHLTGIGIDNVHTRVTALAAWLLGELSMLRHSNGAPMVRLFGPKTMDRRGATIAFYLLDPEGHVYDVQRVEELAGLERISIRTGCFCNPGDGEVAHGISRDEMAECFAEPEIPVTLLDCQRLIQDATGKVPNTIRISLGLVSNFADVWRFMAFAEGFRDRGAAGISG